MNGIDFLKGINGIDADLIEDKPEIRHTRKAGLRWIAAAAALFIIAGGFTAIAHAAWQNHLEHNSIGKTIFVTEAVPFPTAFAFEADPAGQTEDAESITSRAYELIQAHMQKDINKNAPPELQYPDYYGGIYYSDEDSLLHVAFCGATEELISEYRAAVQSYIDYVKFEEVAFSRNELQLEADRIAGELQAQGYIISRYGVDEKQNCVSIAMPEFDYECSSSYREEIISISNYNIIITVGELFSFD